MSTYDVVHLHLLRLGSLALWILFVAFVLGGLRLFIAWLLATNTPRAITEPERLED